jgi:hypothetical protein
MKKILIIVVLFTFSTIKISAQIKVANNLTTEEQYCKENQQKGNFFGTSAWVFNEIQKPITSEHTKNIRIFFPKDFYVEKKNGSKYAQGHLRNNTSEGIKISRLDSTIDFIQEHFLIDGIWVSGQKNEKASCGNSYFDMELKAFSKIEFQLSISDLVYGNIKVPFKISITIGEKIFESNVIDVFLFENQINNLTK